ncbi:MAG: hypothetical protein WBK28_02870, partial [Minisyncoccia bacterium]
MRDVIMIAVACVLAILVGAWLFFLDSPDPVFAPSGPQEASVRVLAEGQDSGAFTERKNYRIQNTE